MGVGGSYQDYTYWFVVCGLFGGQQEALVSLASVQADCDKYPIHFLDVVNPTIRCVYVCL